MTHWDPRVFPTARKEAGVTTPDDMTLADLWNPAEEGQPDYDDVYNYVRETAYEIIRDTREATREDSHLGTNEELASFISADQVESASFANFVSAPGFSLDPELLHCLIEFYIAYILGEPPSTISSQY